MKIWRLFKIILGLYVGLVVYILGMFLLYRIYLIIYLLMTVNFHTMSFWESCIYLINRNLPEFLQREVFVSFSASLVLTFTVCLIEFVDLKSIDKFLLKYDKPKTDAQNKQENNDES